jgi:CRP-like cAMP-binding protein
VSRGCGARARSSPSALRAGPPIVGTKPGIEDAAQIAKTSAVPLRKDAKVELLRKVPLFAEASRRELGRIASIATEVEHPQGVTLIREGSRDDGFFILIQGEVDVRRRARLLRTLRRGDFFGEIGLLATIPRTASVTTGTPVQALVVSGSDFKKLLYESPTLALKVLQALGNRLSTTALSG